MPLSQEEFEAAVQYSHIDMEAQALAACRQEMAFVLAWAKEMDALPLEGVAVTMSPNLPDNCPTRPDEVQPSLGSQNALAQAPNKLGSCFVVPQILD